MFASITAIIIIFIFFFLALLGFHCCPGFSLVAMHRGYSLLQCVDFSLWWASHCMEISLQTSLVAEHKLNNHFHGLSCSAVCGNFLDQESNPSLLHWQADSTAEPPGKPCHCY